MLGRAVRPRASPNAVERGREASAPGIAPPRRREVGCSRSLQITAPLQQMPEVGGGLRVTVLDTSPPGRRSTVEIAGLVHEHPEVECRIGITSLLGALVGRHRTRKLPALMQDSAEVKGAGRVAEPVSAAILALCDVDRRGALRTVPTLDRLLSQDRARSRRLLRPGSCWLTGPAAGRLWTNPGARRTVRTYNLVDGRPRVPMIAVRGAQASTSPTHRSPAQEQ